MRPWLVDGSLNMIYGKRGIAKTWLCSIMAVVMTRKQARFIDIGPWRPEQPSGVLYIDGEMMEYEVNKRYSLIIENLKRRSLDEEDSKKNLKIITNASIATKYRGQSINLAHKHWRDSLYEYLKQNEQYNILILDNLSCLFPGLNENDKEAWDPINHWLISLRQLEITVIMVHHAGKSGLQRGTSGREDPLDVIIKLSDVSKSTLPYSDRESNATYVHISYDKARNCRPDDTKPFIFKLSSGARNQSVNWGTEEHKNKNT